MARAYVCNRFPSLAIGNGDIRFRSGLYVAENEHEEKLIEGNDWYGVHIHRRDLDPEPATPPAGQKVRQGRKGTKTAEECPVHGAVPVNEDGSCQSCFPPGV